MSLHESAEMYLETIYILTRQRQPVRSVDVAEHMGYSRPSVSRAVGLLKKGGYLRLDDQGCLELTPQGEAAAQGVFERHTVLTSFLRALGVSREQAADDACRIEHVISQETLEAIKKYMSK